MRMFTSFDFDFCTRGSFTKGHTDLKPGFEYRGWENQYGSGVCIILSLYWFRLSMEIAFPDRLVDPQ